MRRLTHTTSEVPSGFCTAAASEALKRAGAETAGLPALAVASAPDVQTRIGRLEQASNQGRTEAAADLCGIYFDGRNGRFDPVPAAELGVDGLLRSAIRRPSCGLV